MATPHAPPANASLPRIYYARAGLPAAGDGTRESLLAGARRAGFNAVLVPVPWLCPAGALTLAPRDADQAATADGGTEALHARLARDARSVAGHGMTLLLRLELQRVARDAHDDTAPDAWYRDPVDDPARDPRLPASEQGVRQLREGPPAGFIAAWAARLRRWTRSGVGGYVVHVPPVLGPDACARCSRHRARPIANCNAWPGRRAWLPPCRRACVTRPSTACFHRCPGGITGRHGWPRNGTGCNRSRR